MVGLPCEWMSAYLADLAANTSNKFDYLQCNVPDNNINLITVFHYREHVKILFFADMSVQLTILLKLLALRVIYLLLINFATFKRESSKSNDSERRKFPHYEHTYIFGKEL